MICWPLMILSFASNIYLFVVCVVVNVSLSVSIAQHSSGQTQYLAVELRDQRGQ